MAFLPARKFDMVRVSVPVWYAHLSPHALHVSQYPSRFKDSMARGELAAWQAGIGRQLAHTITGREACTGTANIDIVLVGVLVCFQDVDDEMWDGECERFLHGCNCLKGSPESFTSTNTFPWSFRV